MLSRIFIGALAVVFLAGCTQSGNTVNKTTEPQANVIQESSGATDSNKEDSSSISVSLVEYAFVPNVFTLKQGETSTFDLTNDGTMTHTFTVPDLQIDESLSAGESRSISVTPDQTGTFELFCNIPGHKALGQVGTVTVN